MGMDVVGRGNKNAYFRANVWSWRPIVDVMTAAGYLVPKSWNYNDGEGLQTQEECNVLADLLEKYLKHNKKKSFEHETDWDMKVDRSGVFGRGKGFIHNPYTATRAHVEEFIKFLRMCGGFQIW